MRQAKFRNATSDILDRDKIILACDKLIRKYCKMKRVFFAVGETMTSRIRAACEDTHPSELYAFADHSKRQIIKCYKKVEF
jgi:hypothetical protein